MFAAPNSSSIMGSVPARQHGLVVVFALATALTVLAILASALRGRRPVPSPEPAQDTGSRQPRKSGTKPV
jgi:hypothetical protein